MYDIFFISYNEPNAELNWARIKSRIPSAKRISGIKGIHQAHMLAAKRSFTPMFWVVDGDAEVLDSFKFDYTVWEGDYDIVHVWRSCNPVNGLEYGYGGVKLLPKKLTLALDTNKPDMTTSIGTRFKPMPEISNITAFNTDEFSTWRSAFRECVKLASKVIDDSHETIERLDVWCNVAQGQFSEYAIEGARAGRHYGEENRESIEQLLKINDFDWLREQYEKNYKFDTSALSMV